MSEIILQPKNERLEANKELRRLILWGSSMAHALSTGQYKQDDAKAMSKNWESQLNRARDAGQLR